jgi:arylsulfatase A-like enzyme
MSRTQTVRRGLGLVVVAVLGAVVGSGVPVPVDRTHAQAEIVDERPNILVVITDDQRFGTEGADSMPRTHQFFGAEGRFYPNAYVTTPQCCPSRASIMTGLYAHNHTVHDNYTAVSDFPMGETLQANLQQAGYTTGLVGKYLNGWPDETNPPNFDSFAFSNFGYWDRRWNLDGLMTPIEGYNTDIVGDKAVDFIEAHRTASEPWLLLVAPFAPHKPFRSEAAYRALPVSDGVITPAMAETDRTDKPPFIQGQTFAYEPDGARIRRRQHRGLRSVDDLVTRLSSELRRNGEDNTIAVFVSDNGILWGEHGYTGKKVPYTEAVKVPLYIRWPGVIPGGSVDDRIVANIDLMPTLLRAAGLNDQQIGAVDGRQLLDPSWSRDRLLLEFTCGGPEEQCHRWASTRTPGYQFVEHYDAQGVVTFHEYYDLIKDPWQLTNLYADGRPGNDPPLEPLVAQLAADRSCAGTACP